MFGKKKSYPNAVDPGRVGKYPSEVFSGGGYFYDDVLEYRVWMKEGSQLVCYSFGDYPAALKFSQMHASSEKPVVLVQQNEYVDEQEPGEYVHVKRERLAEWQVDWLDEENRGTHTKVPEFLKHMRQPE